MIGYATLGTNDLEKSSAFYDELFSDIGVTRVMTDPRMTVWGDERGHGMFSVIVPYDEEPATVGNGTMLAIKLKSLDDIKAIHAKAMSMGASDEGEPSFRANNMSFGYVRDPEGHKLCFYCNRQ